MLFRRIPPRAQGSPQGSRAREAVKVAIETLEAHTVHSSERWIGHPSIPPRVFGPTKYLDELSRQLTKPQTAMTPRLDTDDPGFDTQALSSWVDFQPTQQEGSTYGPKEQSLGQKFAQWFDFTFVDYSLEGDKRPSKLARRPPVTPCLRVWPSTVGFLALTQGDNRLT